MSTEELVEELRREIRKLTRKLKEEQDTKLDERNVRPENRSWRGPATRT